MIEGSKTLVANARNFIFDHRVSPLRHIPDVAVRHYILQVLGFIWAFSFSVAIGSYTFLAASILGHAILIAAAAVTAATFTLAAKRSKLFMRGAGRRRDGEHDCGWIVISAAACRSVKLASTRRTRRHASTILM